MWQHPFQQIKNFAGVQILSPVFVQYTFSKEASEDKEDKASDEEKPESEYEKAMKELQKLLNGNSDGSDSK